MEETSSILNLTQLGLADEGNYSCVGVNSQGEGQTDNILLEVTGFYPQEKKLCTLYLSTSTFPAKFAGNDNIGGRGGC